jgi:hypothetical protein
MKLIEVIEGETEAKNKYVIDVSPKEAALLRELMGCVEGDPKKSYKRVADNLRRLFNHLLGLPEVEDEAPYYVVSGRLRASDLPADYMQELDERDKAMGITP